MMKLYKSSNISELDGLINIDMRHKLTSDVSARGYYTLIVSDNGNEIRYIDPKKVKKHVDGRYSIVIGNRKIVYVELYVGSI